MAARPVSVPENRSHVPFACKVNYGVGALGSTALAVFQLSWMLIFYTNVAGLDPALAGTALMLGKIWDAVTDPAMGNLSDRTKLRMGRRRPYIMLGSIPLAVSFIALWVPPVGWSQGGLFVYLLVANVAFNTFITVVFIPYAALGGELSKDYHERTRLMAVRMVLQTVGWYIGASAVTLNQILLERAEDVGGLWRTALTLRDGYAASSVIFAAVAVLTLVWSAAMVKEPAFSPTRHHMGQLRAFWQTLKNRSFRLLVLAFLGASMVEGMGWSFWPYLLRYWYYLGDEAAMNANMWKVLLVLLLVALPANSFWMLVSRFLGKKKAFLFGLVSVAIITMLNFYMITPHAPWLIYVWLVLLGLVVSCTNLLTSSMIPDIVDEDELETGTRREGSFFGMQTFVQKLAMALGLFLAGHVLHFIGFDEQAVLQSDATVLWIRVVYSFLRGGAVLLSFVVLLRFPLTDQRVAQIRSVLDKRHAALGQAADGESSV